MGTKTKKDLVQEVAASHGLSAPAVQGVVTTFFSKLVDALAEGDRLEFRDFGVFEVVLRKAKVGRNPRKADVAIHIPPKKIVKFTAGKKMRLRVEQTDVDLSSNKF